MTKLKFIKLRVLMLVILAGLVVGAGLGVALTIGLDLPQIQALENFEPTSATRLWSADGQVLTELYVEKRLPLPLEAIPITLRQAVVAVEDRRFYRHPGLDVIRSLGALLRDLRAGRMIQGGSTITQQLAKNLYLSSEKTLSRKLKEIYLALQIERRYTKDEILKLYLNQIYFGAGVYGVGAAAEVYFNKPAQSLTVDECILLAGLIQSPEGHSPFRAPERALARRKIVCNAMVREGYLTPDQAAREGQKPLNLSGRPQTIVQAPDFVQQVVAELIQIFGEDQIYKSGLQVQTTLNLTAQSAAEKILVNGLERLQSNRKKNPAKPMARLQGALVALAAPDGKVTVWTGQLDGNGDRISQPDPIECTPGPAVIPFIYAAAIEKGLTQADIIWDAPVSYRLPDRNESWQPQNSNRRYEGEISIRRAMESWTFVPAVKLLSRIGLDNFIGTARKLGWPAPPNPSLILALGQTPIGLWELTSAYQALAGNGIWTQAYSIIDVRDQSGRIIHQTQPNRRAALSPETAFIMTDMLVSAFNISTNRTGSALPFPLAGSSAQSEESSGNVFAGYSPEICAGLWIGSDASPAVSLGYGTKAIQPIWLDFMTQVHQGLKIKDFERPSGIVTFPMDRYTGRPARPGQPGYVEAAFRAGSETKPSSHEAGQNE
ncbi:MAG: transglycosylase domain-containing protein [Deltaproteobacteria bacterium]|nr:transglycosylase domain-containing protein [Deltaproteobacteria bacterium]